VRSRDGSEIRSRLISPFTARRTYNSVYKLDFRRQQPIVKMGDRQNTIVCCFDPRSPRITAFQIHEWIIVTLRLDEEDIRMIHIDGTRRHVYIKFTHSTRLDRVRSETNGHQEFKHDNGELSQVIIELAGMGRRKIRIASLPPEINDRMIKDALLQYGEVRDIHEEQWTRAYRYKVSNGILIADMHLKQHLPSHLTIAGHRVLVSYEGQPATCYGCNDTRHLYPDCPRRKRVASHGTVAPPSTWADVVSQHKTHTPIEEAQPHIVSHQMTQRTEPQTQVHEPLQTTPHQTPEHPQDKITVQETERPTDDKQQQGPEGERAVEQSVVTSNAPTRDVPEPRTDDKQGPIGPGKTQNIRREVGGKREGRDLSPYSQDSLFAREEPKPPPTEDEPPSKMPPDSPKRTKKLRTERDVSSYRERTRGKTKQAAN
jgi:hypothetical protein